MIRNLEVIGEAIKKIPEEFRNQYPAVEWKKIAGVRDVLIHEYFGIDVEIVYHLEQAADHRKSDRQNYCGVLIFPACLHLLSSSS